MDMLEPKVSSGLRSLFEVGSTFLDKSRVFRNSLGLAGPNILWRFHPREANIMSFGQTISTVHGPYGRDMANSQTINRKARNEHQSSQAQN